MFGLGISELIILVLIFGVPILIYVLVRKYKGNQREMNEDKYKGVAGWLLLFCLGLTVFSPSITIGSLVTAYSQTSIYFDQFPGLFVIIVIDTLLSVILTAYGIYAGVRLWRIQPNAVQTAKRYLLCFLGYQVIASILPFTAGLPSAANDAMTAEVAKDTVRGIIYVSIWYSYLNKSQRVRVTYQV